MADRRQFRDLAPPEEVQGVDDLSGLLRRREVAELAAVCHGRVVRSEREKSAVERKPVLSNSIRGICVGLGRRVDCYHLLVETFRGLTPEN
jgi:hypothetical protein